MKNRPLSFYLEARHVRYMEATAEAELHGRTKNCNGGNAERLFWVLHGMVEYPRCQACSNPLTSKQWRPFLKEEQRTSTETSGYLSFCGRECAYKYGPKQESYKKTSIERYGVDHPMKAAQTILKVKATNEERYGEPWPNRWDGAVFRSALKQKRGVEKVRHDPKTHQAIVESKAKATTEGLPARIAALEEQHHVTCQTDLATLGTVHRVYDIPLLWKHTCGVIYTSHISERGIRSCPSCWSGVSRGEQDLATFVRDLGLKLEQRTKSVIPPRELDIFVPEQKIAIEFDGTYWHNAKLEPKHMALNKLDRCAELGIKLITVQEHLWVNRQELVKNQLKVIFGRLERNVPADDTELVQLEEAKTNSFLVENHLHGSVHCSVGLGLTFNDELVAVATFGKSRRSKHATWELIRMAFKKGVSVQGGESKLIKAFQQEHEGAIVSYEDRCWSMREVYERLGFKLSHVTPPSYWWIHHHLGVYSRHQAQKSKLERLLGDLGKSYRQGLSAVENMRLAGFLPLYDRGSSVWILS